MNGMGLLRRLTLGLFGSSVLVSVLISPAAAQRLLGPTSAPISAGSPPPRLLGPTSAPLSPGMPSVLPSASAAGAAVDVLWNGRWYPARIKQVVGPNQWLITYDGYSSAWDEVVSSDRMRARQRQATASPSRGASGSGTRGGSGTGILYPNTHWDNTGQHNPIWINPYSVPGW